MPSRGWALLTEADNMMWNLLSPLNWFHYSTSNYKSTMWKAKERQEGVEGGFGLFYLASTQDVSLQYHSISPEWLISCGVAAKKKQKKKKSPISTGMFCHLMPYLIAGLYNSVKSGPKAVRSVSSSLWTPTSPQLCRWELRPIFPEWIWLYFYSNGK